MLISNSNAGFPKYYQNNLLVLNNVLLGEGDCPIYCRMFSINLDLDPLDASSTPSLDNQKCLKILLMSSVRQNWPQMRTNNLQVTEIFLSSIIRSSE